MYNFNIIRNTENILFHPGALKHSQHETRKTNKTRSCNSRCNILESWDDSNSCTRKKKIAKKIANFTKNDRHLNVLNPTRQMS